MNNQESQLIAAAIMGYLLQWARAPKQIPVWLSWAALGVAAAGLYVWMTPAFDQQIRVDWRGAFAGLASFILAARGAASTSSDTKLAPKTDSL